MSSTPNIINLDHFRVSSSLKKLSLGQVISLAEEVAREIEHTDNRIIVEKAQLVLKELEQRYHCDHAQEDNPIQQMG